MAETSENVSISNSDLSTEDVTEISTNESNDANSELFNVCILIVQDAITDLQIYEKVNKLPKIKSNYKYRTLEEKFAPETNSEDNLHCISDETDDFKSRVKLQQDRSYLEYCLKKLVDELSETQTTHRFEKLLSDHEQEKLQEENLLSESENLILKEKQLENELEHIKIQQHLICNEKDELMGSLKDQYENLLREYRIKEDYVQKWEESLLEQEQAKLNQQQEANELIIRDFTNKIEREKRVHKEIEAYINSVIQDHHRDINYWLEKYTEDLKCMENKISSKKNNRLTQYLKITAIAALYKEREKEMQAYKDLKELQKQKAEEIAWLNKQATKIQAWWRGVMVRRKLGPYKVKKPKPKGKAKSGK